MEAIGLKRCTSRDGKLTSLLLALSLLAPAGAARADTVLSPFIAHTFDDAATRFLTEGDIDGDGDLDLLVRSLAEDVRWLEQSPDGWVEHAIADPVGWSEGIGLGDLDGDGDVDVVLSASDPSRILWFEQGPSGWTEHFLAEGLGDADRLFVVDLHGDGGLDVVANDAVDGDLTVWINTAGDGSSWFAEQLESAHYFSANGLNVADVDGDGDVDLLVSSSSFDRVAWFENADGWVEHTVDDAPSDFDHLSACDVDGDGDMDILGAEGDPGGRLVWWEQGAPDSSSWSQHTLGASGYGPIEGQDVDADGDCDIVTAGRSLSAIGWFDNIEGDGSVFEDRIEGPGAGTSDFVAADFGGDGDLDLISSAVYSDVLLAHENLGGERAWSVRDAGSMGSTLAVASGDFDGDGTIDLVSLAQADGVLVVSTNPDAAGRDWTELVVEAGFDEDAGLAVGDLDGDGALDVLAANPSTQTVRAWLNVARDATTWTEVTIDEGNAPYNEVAVGDADGDGDLDVVGSQLYGGGTTWWANEMGDATAWSPHTISDTGVWDGAIAFADLGGPGLDVIGTRWTQNVVVRYVNELGDGSSWVARNLGLGLASARAVHAGDLDGDGDQDLVAGGGGGELRWLQNPSDELSTWSSFVIAEGPSGVRAIALHDLDGDSDLDVVAFEDAPGALRWWENVAGNGSDWAEHLLQLGIKATWRKVVVAHVDCDSDPDLVVTSSAGTFWLENEATPHAADDADADGFSSPLDCDDCDPTLSPAEPDVCDGLDNNCDGEIDEPFDIDGDGWTSCNGDCDDEDAAVHPDAADPCDGVDNDCDGEVDEDCSSVDECPPGEDSPPDLEAPRSGCRCNGSDGRAGWIGWLGLLLVLRRRRG